MFGVSTRTLRRRRHELGMGVEGREFTQLGHIQLDHYTRQVFKVGPGVSSTHDGKVRKVCDNILQSR